MNVEYLDMTPSEGDDVRAFRDDGYGPFSGFGNAVNYGGGDGIDALDSRQLALHFAEARTVKLNPAAQCRLKLHLGLPLVYCRVRLGHDAPEKFFRSQFHKAPLRFDEFV
jgi:hypothetical protein